MLKLYEIARILAEPVLPYFYARIRSDVRALTRKGSSILDVGGRRSPYTVGLPAHITIFDLPRESEAQHALELGIDNQVLETIRRRRSNIGGVVLGDMTRCPLPSASFDGLSRSRSSSTSRTTTRSWLRSHACCDRVVGRT